MLETSSAKQGKLFQFMVTLSVMLALIGFLIGAFEENEPLISKEAVSNTAFSFSKSLSMIRTEWQMQGRKPAVYFREFDVDGNLLDERIVKVTKVGWAYATNTFKELDCHETWRQVLNTTMTIQNQPLQALTLVVNTDDTIGIGVAYERKLASAICRFKVNELLWFDYTLSTGQVRVGVQGGKH
jgi:hypothetical protein